MQHATSPLRLFLALGCVYIFWGGTYLGIKVAIETMPPFLMAGTRFVLAGTMLYAWARWRGAAKPQPLHWRNAAVVGVLLLIVGNGGVVWAEQTVDSGIAALLVATEPIWIVMLAWLLFREKRPTGQVVLGIVLGFAGMLVLVWDTIGFSSEGLASLPGVVVLNLAAIAWAVGSLFSRNAALPDSPVLATGMEMLWGGMLFLIISLSLGEFQGFAWAQVSGRSWVAFIYLVACGSLLAFTAYIWLLRHATPAVASTYAYVNPMVAVFLGWAVGGEIFGWGTFVAGGIIVVAIILITGILRPQEQEIVEGNG